MRRALLTIFTVVAVVFALLLGMAPESATADTSGGTFVPSNGRLADSRYHSGGLIDSPLVTSQTYEVPIAGTHGVPGSGVQAVSITLTSVAAVGSGNILLGSDSAGSGTYMVFNAGDTVSNSAVVPLDSSGGISVTVTAATNLIVDIQGYFTPSPSAGGLVAIRSMRVADSRYNAGISGTTATGSTATVDLSSVVPASASAAFVSITVTGQTSAGWVTAYATGSTRPATSLNFDSAASRALGSLVTISASRSMSINVGAGGPVNLVVDVEGYVASTSAGSTLTALSTPIRAFDSRASGTKVMPGETISVQTAGSPDIPSSVSGTTGLVANVTVVQATPGAAGYVRMWPEGQPEPTTSTLNYDSSDTYRSVLGVVGTSAGDMTQIHNLGNAPIDVIIDIEGYFFDASNPADGSHLSDAVSYDPSSGTEQVASVPMAAATDVDPTDGSGNLADSTGQVDVDSTNDPSQDVMATDVSPFYGVFGADGRTRISNTTSRPYRSIVYVQGKVSSNRSSGCTGALISPRTVLTAGHCLFDNGHWYSNVWIAAGRNGSSYPYGSCSATNIVTTNGWTKHGSAEWDYGVIELNCSIGKTVGTFGYSASGYTDTSVSITGYPAEKEPAGSMWTENGKIDDRTDRQLDYTIDTTRGQSGGPVYRTISNKAVIVGVVSGGYKGWFTDTNYARRVDGDLISFIKKYAR